MRAEMRGQDHLFSLAEQLITENPHGREISRTKNEEVRQISGSYVNSRSKNVPPREKLRRDIARAIDEAEVSRKFSNYILKFNYVILREPAHFLPDKNGWLSSPCNVSRSNCSRDEFARTRQVVDLISRVVSMRFAANESRGEICRNKWLLRFGGTPIFFSSPTDPLADAISISIIISRPAQSRDSITRSGGILAGWNSANRMTHMEGKDFRNV